MGHVFISYSRQDKDYASDLADDLRQHGFDVWIDDRIDYGDRWWQTIVAAIRACSAFVVVMSPDAEKSEWVEREVLLAQRSLKPIFPLLLEGDEFPLLITVQFADVRGGEMPPEDFYDRLARVLMPKDSTGQIMTPPATEPTAPIVVQKHQNRKARFAGALAGIVALALVGIVLLSGILNDRDDRESGNTDETRTDAPTETLTDTPTEEPTPEVVAQANTETPSPTNSNMPTASYSPSPSPRVSQSPTATLTLTATSSFLPPPTSTATFEPTATPTATHHPASITDIDGNANPIRYRYCYSAEHWLCSLNRG